ncbi:hypothetical protein ACT17_14925 [Mycolicibacterium conceptionense]|uniref:PPE domain-containing protein n=1 Tax=Mycolicibacterium conceptionense TaxID=451644 RepID=A0A0J8U846_9MYCO|nr:PPE domain-containing protein [Mycolicibacterium conceptionense]KMV17586.1 hypothetical protein ACT17_14925 [Mycolicibacterium conceptionense]
MADQPWGASPPEMNAGVLETGSTSATWAAASSAWLGLASATLAALGITGTQMNASLTTISGIRSIVHTAATPPFLTWLGGMAGIAFKQAAICAVVAESYGVARTTMIPSVQSVNNRVREAAAEASNIFGQNTPLIAALNAEYAMYTTNNAAIGNTYGEVITAATLPVPIPPPPPLGSAARAAADAGDAAAQGTQMIAQAGGGQASKAAAQATGQGANASGTSTDALSSMTGQLGSVSQVFQAPMSALQGLTSPLQSIGSLLTAPLSAFGSASGMGGLLGGGSTGSSFTPALNGVGGLPLGGSGLGSGAPGLGGGGGMPGVGGLGGASTLGKLTSSGESSNSRTSVLSGVSNNPAQAKLAGSTTASGAPVGGVPPAGAGAGAAGRGAQKRAEEATAVFAPTPKTENVRRGAQGDERDLFT